MNKIYIVDGVQYDVAPHREEEFLKKFPNATLKEQSVEKPQPVAETTAPAAGQTPDMGSQLESGSLELQSEEPVNLFSHGRRNLNETVEEREARQEAELIARRQETLRDRYIYDNNGQIVLDKNTGQPALRELSSFEKMASSLGNMVNQIQQAIPSASIGINNLTRKIFGNEAIDNFLANENVPQFFKDFGTMTADEADEAVQQQQLQEAEMKQTGSITEGFKNFDIGEIAAGVVNGITSIGSTAVTSALTGGTSLIPEMIGRAYVDYNEALAREEGKTLGEYIQDSDGGQNTWTSIAVGIGGGLLERAGLKGAGKMMVNGLVQSGMNKTFSSILLSGNKEGLTEWVQTGLEALNVAEAKGEDKLKAMQDAMFSQEGLESYLQGFVGGGVMRGGGRNLLIDKKDKLKAASVLRSSLSFDIINKTQEEVDTLKKQKTATKDKEVKKSIDKQIKEKNKIIAETILEENKMFRSMTENEIYRSSKEFDKVKKQEQKKKKVNERYNNQEITTEERNILLDEIQSNINNSQETLTKIKTEALNRSDANLEKNLETAEKLSEQIEKLTFKRFKNAAEVEKYLLSRDKRQTKQSKIIAEGQDGVIFQNKKTGEQEIVINEEVAKKTGAINVGSHEFLHAVLFKTLKDSPDTAISLGNSLKEELDKLNSNEVNDSEFKERLELYEDESSAVQGEEVLALFSDAAATGDLKFNENLFTKIGDQFRKIFDAVGYKRTFDSGRDVYNFIKDYNKDISKGGLRKALIEGAKEGFKGKLIKAKNIEKEAEQSRKDSRSNLKSLLDKYKTKERLVQQSLLKTPQGQETFDFLKSEFGQEVAPIVEAVTKRLYDPIPQDAKRGVSREKYKNAMIANLATIVATEYDPSKQDLDKFVSIRAFQRSNRLAGDLGIESMVEQGGAGITTDVTEARAVTTDEKAPDEVIVKESIIKALNIPASIIEKIEKLAELAAIKADKELEGKEFSDLKKLAARNKAFNEIFSKRLFNDIKEILGKNTKNSKDFTKYLNKNYEALLDAALNNIDFQKGGGISADWNRNPPTKEEFIEYYEAINEKPSTRSDRKKSLNNAIARQIANEARINFAKKDPATAEIFKKKHNITLASKSYKANEKVKSRLDRQFRLYNGDVNQVLRKHLKTELPKIKDEKDIKNLMEGYKKFLLPLFPKEFFFFSEAKTMNIFSNSGASGRELAFDRTVDKDTRKKLKKFYIDEVQKLRNFKGYGKPILIDGKPIESYKFAGYDSEIGKNENDFRKNNESGKIVAFNKKWGTIHREMWSRINEAIKNNEDTTGTAIAFAQYMKLSANNDFHPNRLGAQFFGFSKNPKGYTTDKGKFKLVEWEHAMPQTGAYMYLLDSALDKSRKFSLDYNAIINNFKLIALDKNDDVKITSAGYRTSMNEGFLVFSSSFLERYFNPNVALFNSGIDPNGIELLDGRSIAEAYNIDATGQSTTQMKSSKSLNQDFNKMLERVKGVAADATYSEARAIKLGKKNNPFKFFVPYSAEDYMGLIYPTLGRGKEGDSNLKWYKENIIDVYARGIRDFEIAKQKSMTQWNELKKQIKNTPAKLGKEAVRDFTNEEAVRLYLWNQQNMLPENVAKKDIEAINKYIESKPELKAFAEQIQGLTADGYPAPTGDWLAGTITTDLVNYTNTASRAQYLQQWQDNVDTVYSKDNLNKLKAIYGEDYTEALQDMLYRMKTGRNRPTGANKLTNQFMNWVNDSVGTIMFFNTRSALLQTISAVNYLNFTDNNPIKAAAAFANFPQYVKDFTTIFNSDFLKQRRSGLKTDVNADEIARATENSSNKIRAMLAAILKKGFLPTQLADSFAISVGGASFYRNRVNSLMKDGLTKEQAEEQAFLDFKETTEESQQSSRPDRVSMQQASPLGRVILAFANTPMQYTRLTKKAILDLANGRGDWKTNLSKLVYYGAVQNIIFTALQSAMFAMLFSDEEDDEEKEKYGRIGNGIADTLLRGSGVYGAGVAMLKNITMEAIKQYNSGRPDYTKAAAKITSISPPVDSKIRKLAAAGRTFTYKQEIEKMKTRGFDIDNPAYMAAGQVASALANVPLDRAVRKMNNLKTAIDQDTKTWESIFLSLGYSEWDLGMIDRQRKEEKQAEKVKKTFMKLYGPKLSPKQKRMQRYQKMNAEERKKYLKDRVSKGLPLFKKELPNGVLGRANKDGSIEVADGLSPAKRKKVIAHEKKHIADMKSGKLNYDDKFIYWNGAKYKRTPNKKINYKGKLYIEGSPALPWEKAANKAEKQIN